MKSQLKRLATHFAAIERDVPLRPIRSPDDYAKAVEAMNMLLDAGAADEKHPLANLVAILGELIGDYDDKYYPSPGVSGVDMLKFLMKQHGLKQSDLPEVASQSNMSEIIAGKRDINMRHVKELKARFGISADAFA